MANKKISQLVGMGTTMDSTDLFVVAEDIGGGNYATVKCEPNKVSEYVLNPISATQISGVNKSVYLDNGSNWDTASTVVTQNPYLQVRTTDGKLVTGSGIGNAVGGDNMGDCKATTDLNLQDNPIINADQIYFGGGNTSPTRIDYATSAPGGYLTLQAESNLILSGINYVFLKGQSIKLNDGAGNNTPFSGEVRITGGNLDIDPDFALKVNEIQGLGSPTAGVSDDNAIVSIKGAFRNVPYQFDVVGGGLYQVDWADSNIQYRSANDINNVDFYNSVNGQTLTLYIANSSAGDLTPTFRSGIGVDNLVRWGGDDGSDPAIKAGKTNVYTFVNINQRIFASAITGYVY